MFSMSSRCSDLLFDVYCELALEIAGCRRSSAF